LEPHSFWKEEVLYSITPESAYVYIDRFVDTERSLFCAQLRYVARWTKLQHRYAEQLGLIDALGLSWNPKHIWDAVPWTFVIDWVAKVGDFLDRYATGALDPVLDVLDYSWSISRSRVTYSRVRFQDTPGAATAKSRVVDYPPFRETAYSRHPLEVDKHTLILSGLSSQEVRLAAALVLSRKRKLGRPKNKRPRRIRRIRFLNRAK
jgi:hypothetical protein